MEVIPAKFYFSHREGTMTSAQFVRLLIQHLISLLAAQMLLCLILHREQLISRALIRSQDGEESYSIK